MITPIMVRNSVDLIAAEFNTIEEIFCPLGIVEADQQIDKRALPRPGSPTTATVSPGPTGKLTPFNIGFSGS